MVKEENSVIALSQRAKEELLNLQVGKEQFLRLWVAEGGCKGKTYQAALDSEQKAGDSVLYEDESLRIISDEESTFWLEGIEIDYSDDLTQGGFRFHNPKAVSSCGCGSSFCEA